MKDRTYNLRELRRETDVTERTVRYYIKEGLLPPPQGSGPFSRYGYEHWLRLQFIKRLKDEYLPLSEIKNLLDSRSTEELDQLARQAGLIPDNGNLTKGQPATLEETSDLLPGLIGGGSGRPRMLREQMASTAWSAPSGAASPANRESSKARPEYYAANFEAAPDTDFEALADFPDAANMSLGGAVPPENAVADLTEDEPEVIVPPPPPYTAPGQARQAFSARSFMAGAPAPMAPGAAPSGAGAPMPPGGINRSVSPMRAMRMSRFAANEIASDSPGEVTSDVLPLEKLAEPPEPPVMAPMPVMASMAEPMPAPMAAPASPPESVAETVTGQTWERLEVAPGVELHIEKRIADTHRPALANLLHTARRLFGPKEI